MTRIKELMSKHVVKVTSVTLLPAVALKMRQENIGVIPVVDDGQVLGIVTDRDIATKAVAQGRIDRPVKEVMTQPATTIDPDASPGEALRLMTENQVRRLPVVDATGLVGMLSLEDLTETGETRELLDALKTFHRETRHR